MAIDHSIYFQQKTPDLMGSVEKGMRLNDLMQKQKLAKEERQRQQGVRDAFSAGMQTGPDGKVTFDRNLTLSQLSQADPIKAYEVQQQFKQQDQIDQKQKMEKMLKEADIYSRALHGVKDQESYTQALNTVERLGVDTSEMPRAYDPGLTQRYLSMALSTKDQLDYQLNREKLNVQRQKIQQKRHEKLSQPNVFEKERQKRMAQSYVKRQDAIREINKNINAVDKAINAQIDYSRNTHFGTGPFASGFGLAQYLDTDTATLNADLKAVNLKNMTNFFGGMAKAIDSNAERRAWEGTQADIKNPDQTNMSILLGQKSILLKDKAEAAAQQAHVRNFGSLDESYESPIDGKVKTMITPTGEMILVDKNKVSEARKQGLLDIDEFSRIAIRRLQPGIDDAQAQGPPRRAKTHEIDWLE